MADESGSVWVFLGEGGGWPSAVLTARELAERWIGDHGLTGMLTENRVDVGIYDWAVPKDFFCPGKPAHSSAALIAGFTTAHQDHARFTDGSRLSWVLGGCGRVAPGMEAATARSCSEPFSTSGLRVGT